MREIAQEDVVTGDASYANWLPRWNVRPRPRCGDAIACTHRPVALPRRERSGHELTAHQGDHRPALAVSQQAERTLVHADQPFDFGNAHVTGLQVGRVPERFQQVVIPPGSPSPPQPLPTCLVRKTACAWLWPEYAPECEGAARFSSDVRGWHGLAAV